MATIIYQPHVENFFIIWNRGGGGGGGAGGGSCGGDGGSK